ncbi:MAG: hypothetical protein R3C26_18765 [Calditrichia bacterium]
MPNHVLEIDTTWDLRDAVEFANNNASVDTIRLVTSGGVYTSYSTSDVAILKPLAIVAADGLAENPLSPTAIPNTPTSMCSAFSMIFICAAWWSMGHIRSATV